LEDQIEFLALEQPKPRGVGLAIAVSIVLHIVTLTWLILTYHPVTAASPEAVPRYIELIRQQPKSFEQAPGRKTDTAPIAAPWSNANRRASMPKPTGDRPTTRPGDNSALFVPPMTRGDRGPQPVSPQQAQQAQEAEREQRSEKSAAERATPQTTPAPGTAVSSFAYHPAAAASANHIDWKSAIQEVGRVASLSNSGDAVDIAGAPGGEKGFAENGPVSFETQWYDWGDYAESMVNRIRVNWYANMPTLIRMGVKGLVTIRFTIHRDGTMTDITTLSPSGVPPYDFAARKALELSSPLNALPRDFPNETERVTCQFYYNLNPPTGR
jgi:TonB family protein